MANEHRLANKGDHVCSLSRSKFSWMYILGLPFAADLRAQLLIFGALFGWVGVRKEKALKIWMKREKRRPPCMAKIDRPRKALGESGDSRALFSPEASFEQEVLARPAWILPQLFRYDEDARRQGGRRAKK